jgi:hypothetical protein
MERFGQNNLARGIIPEELKYSMPFGCLAIWSPVPALLIFRRSFLFYIEESSRYGDRKNPDPL